MADSTVDLIPYLRKIDDYDLLEQSYYGNGGFADGTFLFRHRRETAEQYAFRQMLVYYLNYVAPVVNSHVDPVFKDPAARDYSGPASNLWAAYVEDVDGAGTNQEDFMKMAALQSKIFGAVLIVTDNAPEPPATVAEVPMTPTRRLRVIWWAARAPGSITPTTGIPRA